MRRHHRVIERLWPLGHRAAGFAPAGHARAEELLVDRGELPEALVDVVVFADRVDRADREAEAAIDARGRSNPPAPEISGPPG